MSNHNEPDTQENKSIFQRATTSLDTSRISLRGFNSSDGNRLRLDGHFAFGALQRLSIRARDGPAAAFANDGEWAERRAGRMGP